MLTISLLDRLRCCTAIVFDEDVEDGSMIFFVSLRQATICFISSGIVSQEAAYLVSLVWSDRRAFSARIVIASQFHGLLDDRGWYHAMIILSMFGPPSLSSLYF